MQTQSHFHDTLNRGLCASFSPSHQPWQFRFQIVTMPIAKPPFPQIVGNHDNELRQSLPNLSNIVARLAALESPLFESSKAPGWMKISHCRSSSNHNAINLRCRKKGKMQCDSVYARYAIVKRRMHDSNAISQLCSFKCPRCLAMTQEYFDFS